MPEEDEEEVQFWEEWYSEPQNLSAPENPPEHRPQGGGMSEEAADVVTNPQASAESARISLVREARWMLMTVLGANDPASGARAVRGRAPTSEVGGPSSGHFVDLLVYETPQALFAGGEPLAQVHWVWGEDGPAEELDEESYRQRAGDPRSGDLRPQAFYDLFYLAPEGDGRWQLGHSFGGLFRGRRMFNGVRHWLVRQGDVVAVEDTDIWFS